MQLFSPGSAVRSQGGETWRASRASGASPVGVRARRADASRRVSAQLHTVNDNTCDASEKHALGDRCFAHQVTLAAHVRPGLTSNDGLRQPFKLVSDAVGVNEPAADRHLHWWRA